MEDDMDSLINQFNNTFLLDIDKYHFSKRHCDITRAIYNICCCFMDSNNELMNEIDKTLNDYAKLYHAQFNKDVKIYDEKIIHFVINNINLWFKYRDLIYAYNVMNITSYLVNYHNTHDEILYIEEVPYYNNLCIEFNSLLFLNREISDDLFKKIDTVFVYYLNLVEMILNNQLHNQFVLNKERLYFIRTNLEKWFLYKQFIYVYNVFNNIGEVLYEGNSEIVFLKKIDLSFFQIDE